MNKIFIKIQFYSKIDVLNKAYNQAMNLQTNGDEEQAFLMMKRCFTGYNFIKSFDSYKSNRNSYKNLFKFNDQQIIDCIKYLSENLEKRYYNL